MSAPFLPMRPQCGEVYFEEREVDAIQDLLKAVDQKTDALALSE